MAQTLVNFRMDEDLKKEMEEICKELGMSLTTAFTIYAKQVIREKRIPFDICIDPFYKERNYKHLLRIVEQIESGKAKLVEHELIED